MSPNDPDQPEPVGPQNPDLPNSPILQRAGEEQIHQDRNLRASVAPGHASCMWDGKEYSDGGAVCEKESGTKYKCWNGRWVDIGNC